MINLRARVQNAHGTFVKWFGKIVPQEDTVLWEGTGIDGWRPPERCLEASRAAIARGTGHAQRPIPERRGRRYVTAYKRPEAYGEGK